MKAKYKGLWSRWHRFDDNGVKYIRKFAIDETPDPLIEHGYSEWIRGTGKLTDQHYNNVVTGVRNACVGVPKTPEQKEKMRQAKLGIPKSDEHRQNMKLSWQKKRQQKYKDAIKQLEQLRQA